MTPWTTTVWMPAPMLAWRPFLEPLPIDSGWLWLSVPLVLGVAVVYKTIKLPQANLRELPQESLKLAAQVLLFMAFAALLLTTLTWLF
ncbi:MAG: hypothetical protein AAF328_04995 [Planctomycetota bacterium]